MDNSSEKFFNFLRISSKTPFWLIGLIQFLFIVYVIMQHEQNKSVPIPFIIILALTILSAIISGFKGGLLTSAIASGFIVYSLIISFGPPTLTGGIVQAILGITVISIIGLLLGSLKDLCEELFYQLREVNVESIDSLRESEQNYRTLMDDAVDGIFIINKQVQYLDGNRAWLEMIGYNSEELKEMSIQDIIDPNDLTSQPLRINDLLAGKTVSTERKLIRKDGSSFIAELHAKMLEDGRLQAIVRDLTDRIEAEKERENLQFQLFQSQKMEIIGQLAGGIAHDFNNYLTSIMGYSEVLVQSLSQDPKLQDFANEIHSASIKSAALVQQLLIFSKHETVKPRIINVNHNINNLTNMLERLIGETISISLNLQPNIPNIKIDSGQFDQIIINLVVNAKDAMSDLGKLFLSTNSRPKREETTQLIKSQTIQQSVVISVKDTGNGIDKEIQQKIFEPFFTTKKYGTGLGLAIIKRIVEENNGKIILESEINQGTTVEIIFPSTEIIQPEEAHRTTNESIESISIDKSILIVEDHDEITKFLETGLSDKGFIINSANSVSSALSKIQELKTIDLIISDIILPDGNGLEMINTIKSRYSDIKVLFITGYADLPLLRKVKEQDYEVVEKPFTINTLISKINKII